MLKGIVRYLKRFRDLYFLTTNKKWKKKGIAYEVKCVNNASNKEAKKEIKPRGEKGSEDAYQKRRGKPRQGRGVIGFPFSPKMIFGV